MSIKGPWEGYSEDLVASLATDFRFLCFLTERNVKACFIYTEADRREV